MHRKLIQVVVMLLIITVIFSTAQATREIYHGYWPNNIAPSIVYLRNCPYLPFWEIWQGVTAWNGVTIRVHLGSVQLVSSLRRESIGIYCDQNWPQWCPVTNAWVPPIYGQARLFRKRWWGYSEISPPYLEYEYAYARIAVEAFWFAEESYTTYGLGHPDLGKKIVSHEIGHTLGLGHPTSVGTQTPAVMHQGWRGYWLPQQHDRTNVITKYGTGWD